jgi:hypothetical protein
VALVQSPEEAAYPDMPRSAIEHGGDIDLVGSVDVLAAEICRLVGQEPAAKPAASENALLISPPTLRLLRSALMWH